MLNSRDISLLRDDVEVNCRAFLKLCEAEGLKVLVTQTVRDAEYQAELYAQGRTKPGKIVTKTKIPTYHGDGLAFDICQNIKGKEYSDAKFFERCGAIGKKVGFSWGGDWKGFVDRPHFQWDEHGRYSWSKNKKPGRMPQFEEVDEVITAESIKKMDDDAVMALVNRIQTVLGELESGKTLKTELEEAVRLGITDGSNPKAFATREQAAIMVKRSLAR